MDRRQAQGRLTTAVLWEFTNSANGWSGSGLTAANRASSILLTSLGSDPQFRVSGLSFAGANRLRRTAGSGWDGKCYYTTAGHGESDSYYKAISEPSWAEFTNALKYSEQFDQSFWSTKANISISANQLAAPDGALTADKLIESATAGSHQLGCSAPGISPGLPHVFSVYAKAGERTVINLLLYNPTDGAYGRITVDLTDGSVQAVPSLIGSGGAVNVGDGWWRVWVAGTPTVTGGSANIFPVVGGSTSYTGDGTSGLYLWGAQLVPGVSVLTPYVQTEYLPAGDFVIAVWDMHALTAGGNDWSQNTITGLRLDLGNSSADQFEVDWIAVSPNPGRYGRLLATPFVSPAVIATPGAQPALRATPKIN